MLWCAWGELSCVSDLSMLVWFWKVFVDVENEELYGPGVRIYRKKTIVTLYWPWESHSWMCQAPNHIFLSLWMTREGSLLLIHSTISDITQHPSINYMYLSCLARLNIYNIQSKLFRCIASNATYHVTVLLWDLATSIQYLKASLSAESFISIILLRDSLLTSGPESH